MVRSFRAGLVFFLSSVLASTAHARAPGPPAGDSADREFAVDVYRRVAAAPGNVFVSPWSIRSALGMVYAGARGKTEAGIQRALHDHLGQGRYHVEAAQLDASLGAEADRSESEVLTANAVWIADDLHLKQAFRDTLGRRYSAPPRPVDFAQGDAARRIINAWVEKQTRTRIHELIPPNTLNELTRLVLCNAVYFKAAWQDTFRIRATEDALFRRRGGQAVKTPFMNAERELRYCENGDVQVLELPYRGETMGMVIVLPKKPEGLADVERKLRSDSLSSWEGHLRTRLVRVALPKFHLETGYELAGVLGAMGMADAFTRNADFSGIAVERPLFLSQMFHKAYVQVDEHGTEAVGATGGVMATLGVHPVRTPITFIADHPFLFLIRSRANGAVLFMGRMEDPS